MLKYILGGRSIDTAAQHIAMEGVCEHKKYALVGQEAEMERLGLTMLLFHLDQINRCESKFDAICISTKSLFTSCELDEISQISNKNAYFALENQWV